MSDWLALALLAAFAFEAAAQAVLLLQPGHVYRNPRSRTSVWVDILINVGFGLWVLLEWVY